MLGPSRAGRQRRSIGSHQLGHLAALLGVCCALVSASDCGFPQYDFGRPGAGSGGGSGGSGGPRGGMGGAGGGSSGASGSAGIAGSSSGAAGGGNSGAAGSGGAVQPGAAGEAGAAGTGGAACAYPAPVVFPAHCSNTSLDGGETGLNCGGGECVPCSGNQACTKSSDCASNVCTSGKTCSQILSMTYMSMVTDAFTRTPKFSLSIKYLDSLSTALQDLRIRYYFNHNGVAEPVIALDTNATYNPGNSERNISSEVAYQIYRYPAGPADAKGIVTDSYLEITFSSSVSLVAGSVLNLLTTDIVAGSSDASAQFQQATHYSYIATNSPIANNAITIYRGSQLLWGAPPPMNLLPDCAFAAGVNLNGPGVTSGAQILQPSNAARVSYSGSTYQNALALVPATDSGTTTLLHAGFSLGTATASWPVPNGKYWVYAWLMSDLSSDSGQLVIQGNPADKFFSVQQQPSGAAGWARLGPYSADVVDGNLRLSGTGVVNLAGVELFQAAP